MRVVSLVPAATEMIAALGASHLLAGISHECDWPPEVQHLPRVTTTPIDASAESGAIDAAVRAARAAGRAVIGVDRECLAKLRPDLIVTQDLCDVCAVIDGAVLDISRAIDPAPRLLSMRARTLEGIFGDIEAVGTALGREPAAAGLTTGLRERLAALRPPADQARPRVVCIEWLDPVFLAAHWVPELIECAGGVDVGATAGSHSRMVELEAVEALAPDLVLVAPCGFNLARAEKEFRAFEERMLGEGRRPPSQWGAIVRLLDGNAYTSRPGPRVVDGAELIAAGVAASGKNAALRPAMPR